MNGIISLSPSQLRRAADLQECILALQDDLNQILGATSQPNHEPAPQKKRKMSAAARARIAAGARARWARIKGTTTAQPRRKMSAAAKAKLAGIARARWKKARAAGKNAL
jgi:hypothetical protein